ncbi:Golgi-associated plant pathogenesis-related protein 1-like [Heptranchias perlo]|uniref:Golgi-associated plant pathogenesis-related protein 1-like n=1 Tax=Heptranchias perlo TaxID=212740 RepID=UPI00355984C6
MEWVVDGFVDGVDGVGVGDLSTFEKEALDAHNEYRARHNTAPLSFSQELSKDCKVWANVLTQDGVIAQSPTNFGENIWSKPSITEGEVSGKEAVDSWYSEIKYYDFENPSHSDKTEHFTQLIWQESTDMGIAYVVSDKGAFVVAQYKPRGNVTKAESFANNVRPLDTAYSKPSETPAAEPEPAPKPEEAEATPAGATPAAEPTPAKEEKKKSHRHCAKKKDPRLKKAERSPCE